MALVCCEAGALCYVDAGEVEAITADREANAVEFDFVGFFFGKDATIGDDAVCGNFFFSNEEDGAISFWHVSSDALGQAS